MGIAAASDYFPEDCLVIQTGISNSSESSGEMVVVVVLVYISRL